MCGKTKQACPGLGTPQPPKFWRRNGLKPGVFLIQNSVQRGHHMHIMNPTHSEIHKHTPSILTVLSKSLLHSRKWWLWL